MLTQKDGHIPPEAIVLDYKSPYNSEVRLYIFEQACSDIQAAEEWRI